MITPEVIGPIMNSQIDDHGGIKDQGGKMYKI